MRDDVIVLNLTQVIYKTFINYEKLINIEDDGLTEVLEVTHCLDETKPILNGLQVAVYESKDTAYLIVRGADVGLGKKLFKYIGADDSYIPKSNGIYEIKTTFQDWIYSSGICSLGLGKFYQYESLKEFYDQVYPEIKAKRIVVGGTSLGGLLAQKLYMEKDGMDICLTYSAISPWWTLNRKSKEYLRKNDFYKDRGMVNFFSSHDIFRYFPLFKRNLGDQKEIDLKPYQSKSNIFASIIERIAWAHITNYYLVNKDGKFKPKKPKYDRFMDFMNMTIKNNFLINIILLIFGIAIAFLSYSALNGLVNFLINRGYSLDFIQNIDFDSMYIKVPWALLGVISFIPSIISKTRWKYLIIVLNILFIWNPIVWFITWILAYILNDIREDR